MACEVLLSDTARHQRDAIILFLMEDARATQRATALIDELDEVIARLAAYPEFYPLARDEKACSQRIPKGERSWLHRAAQSCG